jgi:hypothetical protein
MIAPAGVYCGEEDSFVFLVNPTKDIDDGGMFKGIIATNSEVGKAAIKFQTFYHEGVCGNHIIWGASNICEIKKCHKGNLQPFIAEVGKWVSKWADYDVSEFNQMVTAAKQNVLGANYEELEDNVYNLFPLHNIMTKTAIAKSYEYAVQWEHTAKATPNTVWGFVHGLTRYSQTLGWVDQRHALDMAGKKILNLAV